MSDQNVISVRNLTKKYNNNYAVNDLCFELEKGKVLGLLGANGAGKSTSIECILGTKKKDSGEVTILGMNPGKERKKIFQRVGVQFQEDNYQREIRVNELCEETAALYSEVNDWRELLTQLGLKDKENSSVKDLSGGERQRVFIVLAMIPNPELIFLDELTTGLDTKARRTVWKKLLELKNDGLSMILTSHFMDEVENLCDEVIILKKGETVFRGDITKAIEESGQENFEEAYLWFSDEEADDDEDI